LAPRDVVARSIVREADRTGGAVFLTLAHLDPDYIHRRFPTIADMCRRIGLDLARDPIPVGPAAHYMMGGVDTDEWARTSLPGLFAAGEVACTGVHGANRLASNSLLEGLVFGARAATAMQERLRVARVKTDRRPASGFAASVGGDGESRGAGEALLPSAVPELMWRSAGLFRTREGLQTAVDQLDAAYGATRGTRTASPSGDWWRRLNLVTVARLMARAALRREESRGGHFREDFPERDDRHWKFHVVEQRDDHSH
jgi:L-aspartate oxidase